MSFSTFFAKILSNAKTDNGEVRSENHGTHRKPQLHDLIDTHSRKRGSRLTQINTFKNTGNLSPAETLRRYRTTAESGVFCLGDTRPQINSCNTFQTPKAHHKEDEKTETSSTYGKMKSAAIGLCTAGVRFQDRLTRWRDLGSTAAKARWGLQCTRAHIPTFALGSFYSLNCPH